MCILWRLQGNPDGEDQVKEAAAGADVTLKQYSETMLRSRAINGRYQLLLVSENTLDATALPDADILLLSAEEMEDPSCEN